MNGRRHERRFPSLAMTIDRRVTDELAEALHAAIEALGLAEPEGLAWEVPRDPGHGDYATNAAMLLAKAARRPPRQVAEQLLKRWPSIPAVERLEVAGAGFINVFLAPAWCREALRRILAAGADYGRSAGGRGERIRIEFVSANPTGPLVIVNGRAAAVGDSLARLLRFQGYRVFTEYYVNDAGGQVMMLARSMDARLRQALGEPAEVPEGGYPGEYLVDLARDYLAQEGPPSEGGEARLERLGQYAVRRIREDQERVLREYGVEFDRWVSEERDIRKPGLPEGAIELLRSRDAVYEAEGALWFRASDFGDDEDRVLVKSDGELTYFASDIAYHLFKFRGADRLIDLLGPDHHGYIPRIRAAMVALGKSPESFQAMIIQLVTLLRGGEPVRMSKRRGEFVLMEELIEEVGRDAARFTFLTRRHDSPLEFDLDLVTRQSADNPVYYVQYCHARISSIFEHLRQKKLTVPEWGGVDLSPLALPDELALVKRLLQFPDLVAGAARALEPHRVAYYLQELAAVFHPYYNRHRVVSDDQALTSARLALVAGVGQVVRTGLDLLGVSAPEKM
jgi:arginyl-tRNA synthetase